MGGSLLNEYREGRKQLKKRYKEMNPEDPDRKIIGSMARSIDFVVKWLETGYEPVETPIEHVPGINGYWDDDLGGYVSISHFKNPYLEVEERIDRELRNCAKP